MARGFERLNADLAEGDGVAFVQWGEGVLGFGCGAEIDGGADAVAEFKVAGDEVGVEVGEEDVLDSGAVFLCEGEVLIDVALGIDDDRGSGGFVANQVGGVGKAVQVELVKDQG